MTDRQRQDLKGGKGFDALKAKPEDIFAHRNPERVAVRVERTVKYVSRQLMPEYQATGGETFEELGIDPDMPLAKMHAELIQRWAKSQDGILGYLGQWGFMDHETAAVHVVRIFIDGELVYEQEMI